MNERVAFRICGPLEVTVDGVTLPLGGVRQRSLLALLLVEANHVVSVDRIVDSLWGDEANDRAAATLQVHVSNLRKALSPAAAALGRPELVLTQRPGYFIRLSAAELDLLAFENGFAAARRAVMAEDPRRAVDELRRALALWRGAPLADVADQHFARGIVTRLEAMRLAAEQDRVEAELAIGRHREVLDELAALVADHPLDERLRGLLMLALYRSGRQAEALAAFQDGRRILVEELGLDPGPSLRELEGRILAQDPGLDSPSPVGTEPDPDIGTVLRSSVIVPAGVLVVEGTAGRTIDLRRPVTTIGRRSDRDVVLDDPRASRQHAEIRLAAGGFTVVDCGSSNGTRVNGQHVQTRRLLPGDEIEIGDTHLRFETDAGSAPA